MLHRQAFRVRCDARQSHKTQPTPKNVLDRRQLLASFAAGTIALNSPALAADGQAVGSYLPAAGVEDFVTFVPTAFQTPALRAGVIKPEARYQFNLPPNFKELRISNTQSGNFCMPRCAEPWTEVVFEDVKVGKIALMAVPLLKLTNAKNPKIADLGTPEQLLTRIGPYLTGNYFDEESLQSATSQTRDDGLQYYQYELLALDAPYGPHSITAVTAKGEVMYLFICQATDKQWSKSEKTLRTALASFRA